MLGGSALRVLQAYENDDLFMGYLLLQLQMIKRFGQYKATHTQTRSV